MATPTEWLAEFQANTGASASGAQNQPQIIGLSNGNILIAWDELTEGVGMSAGDDIVGVILDAQGNVVRAPFQINAFRAFDEEGDFDIAATNDGGFVMVYVDDDISSPDQTEIIWERFSSSGSFLSANSVAIENVAGDNLSNPQIALDLTDNSFVVTYTDLVSGDTDINAVSVEFTNVAGTTFTQSSEFAAAQNSADLDEQGDIAILANGNYVAVNQEYDPDPMSSGDIPGVDISIFEPDGTLVIRIENFANGTNTTPRVTSLANGDFVVVWNRADSNTGDILARVYGPTGALVTTTFSIAETAAAENEPDVIALPDGGFVVFWDEEGRGLLARAFHPDGATDGGVFEVTADGASDCDVGVTADGRILFAWQDSGEIFASIWDPRSGVVETTDFHMNAANFLSNGGPVTVAPQGAAVIGTGNDDEILGNLGDDTINGEDGADTLTGGAGQDLIYGDNNDDFISGGTENDDLRGSAGNDTVYGDNGRDYLRGNSGNDDLRGGAGGDTLDGGLDDDEIRGASGDDTLNGRLGDDLLLAGVDDDLLRAHQGNDTLSGGKGADTLYGNPGRDLMFGDEGNDDLRGGNGGDTLEGGSGDDTLRGNTGNDVFVYAPGSDDDLIVGFEAGAGASDVIDLSVYDGVFDDFADVQAAASDDLFGNVVIDLGGGDSITLANVLEAELDADDFLF